VLLLESGLCAASCAASRHVFGAIARVNNPDVLSVHVIGRFGRSRDQEERPT
jgi:hypothetical protein